MAANVKKGQLLLVIDRAPYELQLEAGRGPARGGQGGAREGDRRRRTAGSPRPSSTLDRAQLILDQIEERRERNLLSRKAASQDDFDKAEAQRKKSAAQVEADQASLEQAEADYQIDIDNAKAAGRQGRGRGRRCQDQPGLLPDVCPDRRADRRAEGQGRQPGRRQPGDRAGHHPAARPDGARLPPARPLSSRCDRTLRPRGLTGQR